MNTTKAIEALVRDLEDLKRGIGTMAMEYWGDKEERIVQRAIEALTSLRSSPPAPIVSHERMGGMWFARISVGQQSFLIHPIHPKRATETEARWQAEMLRSAFGIPRIGDVPEDGTTTDLDYGLDVLDGDQDAAPSELVEAGDAMLSAINSHIIRIPTGHPPLGTEEVMIRAAKRWTSAKSTK